MPLFVPQSQLAADAKKLHELEATVTGLTNSKIAFLARLTAGPESFSALGTVSDVVRDGVVTDFIGAVDLVRRLKARVEERLGCTLTAAHGAYPPGVPRSDVRAVQHVIESADLILIQRFFPGPATASVIEAAFASGKPVLYDTDDDFEATPPDHAFFPRASSLRGEA